MEEQRPRFGLLDAALVVAFLISLFVIAMAVLPGCAIRDGYVVADPEIAVFGEYHSPRAHHF